LETAGFEVPALMRAAVYRGDSRIEIEEVPVPEIGPGELLLRVEACGICHTDLKKIEHNLLEPPRIFGHETAGVVVRAGAGAGGFQPGDRVIAFHHVPCGECFYCRRKLYAQCPVYKRVGVTAGFEPAGGGFAQYVRVMPWIVQGGVERFGADVPFARACLVEPVNTCHKAVVQVDPRRGETLLIQGQGPIGLIFTMLVRRAGARVLATDSIRRRRELALRFGAEEVWDPQLTDVEREVKRCTEGRGADAVIVAVSAPGIVEEAMRSSRPGSRILLFAQTSHQERVELSGADICVGERALFGSYSASVDLQKESARLVFSGEVPVELVVSHRLPLDQIRHGIQLAQHPDAESLKIIVEPQPRWAE
jgi:L-iditol 2-dehydrogenase